MWAASVNADDQGSSEKRDPGPPSVTWTFTIPKDLSPDQFCEVIWRIPELDRTGSPAQVVTKETFRTSEIDLKDLRGGEKVAIQVWFEDDVSFALKPLRFAVETTFESGKSRRIEGTLSIPEGYTDLYSYMPSGPADESWFLMISQRIEGATYRNAFLCLAYERR